MAGITFAGTNAVYNATSMAVGATRWNQTYSCFEVFDGHQWTQMTPGEVKDVTLADMVQYAEDQIATQIELEYANNAAIQDAYKVWEEANERFKVILALAEKK